MTLVIGRPVVSSFTYNNTYKKFLWFRKLVEEEKQKLSYSAETLQFDELETIHHTKCKPLNIVLVINEKYQLLVAKVAEMPAKGRLAEFSRKKYGIRICPGRDNCVRFKIKYINFLNAFALLLGGSFYL